MLKAIGGWTCDIQTCIDSTTRYGLTNASIKSWPGAAEVS